MRRFGDVFKSKRGSFSLEAVISMTFVLFLICLGVGYYTYMTLQQVLTQEVHTLATTAKLQGGLTEQDVERFKDRLVDKGHIPADRRDEIAVIAIAEDEYGNEKNVLGVLPLSEGYSDDPNAYSHRGSKEIITVTARIPAKVNVLRAMLRFWDTDIKEGMEYYVFQETVMSERW